MKLSDLIKELATSQGNTLRPFSPSCGCLAIAQLNLPESDLIFNHWVHSPPGSQSSLLVIETGEFISNFFNSV